jgi:hypothetical protein
MLFGTGGDQPAVGARPPFAGMRANAQTLFVCSTEDDRAGRDRIHCEKQRFRTLYDSIKTNTQ